MIRHPNKTNTPQIQNLVNLKNSNPKALQYAINFIG
jgi:hypothetical protein